MPFSNGNFSSHGRAIPDGMLAPLRDSGDLLSEPDAMQRRLNEDGYLFLRGAQDREDVLAARAEVFERLAKVGEVREPAAEGISTGTSLRAERVDDTTAFWKSVCEGSALRRVTHGDRLNGLMATILGEPVRAYDFVWLRPVHPPGKASAFHFDHVYMNRGTDNLLTVWTPLGDIAIEEGPLLLMEGSHRWDDLIEDYRGFDVDADTGRPGHVTLDPVGMAQKRGARLLTENFRVGDVVILTMFLLHGSLDNQSTTGRVRLSCDTRYQPALEPVDERWVGKDPIAHGAGYGSMSASRPSTESPIRR